MSRERRLACAVIIGISLLSIPINPASSAIPFGPFRGLDFENLWAFHHCSLRNAPYSNPRAGTICGDALGRPMNYPPLLYWSFLWTRAFGLREALWIWTCFLLIALFGSLVAWGGRHLSCALFSLTLLFHFPSLFAAERGNNDVLVVALWTLAFLAFRRGASFTSGFLAGAAAAAKIYPLFAVAIVFAGTARRRRFATGVGAAVTVAAVLFPRDSMQYVRVLRHFANEHPSLEVFGHGLPTYFGSLAGGVLALLLLASWARASAAVLDSGGEDLVFAGAIAISTFFARTSWDYNLITAYPLLVVLFRRLRTMPVDLWVQSAALVALLLSVAGERRPFQSMPSLLVSIEVASLLAAGLLAARQQHAPDQVAVECKS